MTHVTLPSGLIVPTSIYGGRPADAPYRTVSHRNRALQEWAPSSGSADETLLASLATLRDQSRDLDRNDSIARGATENIVGNVVSTGLRPQSKLDHELLGISEPEARAFERMAEKIFTLHSSTAHTDFIRQSPFPILQAKVLRAVLLDGDCLVVRRYKPQKGGILGTCLQIIEGRRLRNPDFGYPDRDIREGVELNDDGEAIAYHVVNSDDYQVSGQPKMIRLPRYDETGEEIVLHLFDDRLPGQSRGEPYLTPVIEKFKQISRYAEAEISAAVLSAFFSVFVTSEGLSPFHAGGSHLAGKAPETRQRQSKKFGSGMMVDLLPGEKIESLTPGRPNVNFEPFVDAVLKQAGVGLGLPFEVLTQHFQSSYTAARAAILQAWKTFRIRRYWVVEKFCRPFYAWCLHEAIGRGLLHAPGFDDSMKQAVYLGSEWIGAEMESIDRLKDAKADETRLGTGTTSRRAIVEEQGRDFDKLVREINRENEVFRKPSSRKGASKENPIEEKKL